MAWTLKNLIETCNTVSTEINGKWVPSRPIRMHGLTGLRLRLKDAWAVLKGQAEAFTWPEGQ